MEEVTIGKGDRHRKVERGGEGGGKKMIAHRMHHASLHRNDTHGVATQASTATHNVASPSRAVFLEGASVKEAAGPSACGMVFLAFFLPLVPLISRPTEGGVME